MRILAIDTATEACSVAFHKVNADCAEHRAKQKIENLNTLQPDFIFEICPQQHSQQILPMIDNILRRNQTLPTDLSVVAYGCGPGSFTGVRIAASTVQGLALGANLQVVQVSTLKAMAQQVYTQTGCEEILVLIDARMKEVYMGHFKIINGLATAQISEAAVSPEDAQEYLSDLPPDIGIAGTGFVSYEAIFSQVLQRFTLEVHYPSAKYMLPFAYAAVINNTTIDVGQIEPVYVRDTVTWQKLPNKR